MTTKTKAFHAARSLAAYRAHLTRQTEAQKKARNAKAKAEARASAAAIRGRLEKFARANTRLLAQAAS